MVSSFHLPFLLAGCSLQGCWNLAAVLDAGGRIRAGPTREPMAMVIANERESSVLVLRIASPEPSPSLLTLKHHYTSDQSIF